LGLFLPLLTSLLPQAQATADCVAGMSRRNAAQLDANHELEPDDKTAGSGGDAGGLVRAGLELGAWSFLGTALQVSSLLAEGRLSETTVSESQPDRQGCACVLCTRSLRQLGSD